MAEEREYPRDPIPSDLVQDDASFAETVQLFVDTLSDRVDRMNQSFEDGDYDTLKSVASQLKDSGASNGYKVLTDLANEIEQDVMKQDLESIRRDLLDLQIIVARVVVSREK